MRSIPGVFTLYEPTAPAVPVIFDSPHSGTEYPADFDYVPPTWLIRMGEDTYVDELFASAPAHGAPLLVARFPRSYVDLNRPVDDIDPALLDAPWPRPTMPSSKGESGIGLIWRTARPGHPIYERKLTVAEVEARIRTCYRPYHDALEATADRLHRTFGGVWHVDCHSMPPLGDPTSPEGGRERADFCLGDRDGTTCAPAFTEAVAAGIRAMGYGVAINRPFKGVELVRRIGRPAENRHSLQIEINRDLILNDATKRKVRGFAAFRADIGRLIGTICAFANSQLRAAA